MRKLRVLHVVRQFFPAIGELESFVQCLVLEQLRTNIEAEVLTLDSVFDQQSDNRLPSFEYVKSIPVRRISWRGSFKYPLAPAVFGHLKGYDIIHVHGVDFFSNFLALTRFLHGQRIVLSTHGEFFHSQFANSTKQFLFSTAARLSLLNYRQIYACNEGDYQLLAPLYEGKLHLIDNGVDVKKFVDVGSKRPTRQFVCIGRFSDNKRLGQLVDTFQALKKHGSDYSLLIIGKDWGNNLASLIERIHELGLDSNISIYTGLDDAEVKDKLRDASFIISASENEGFGLSMAEGMAAGLLPIASQMPNLEHNMLQSGVGLLVDFQDSISAALKIHTYSEFCHTHFSALREQAMTEAGRYEWAARAKKFLLRYRELLGTDWRKLHGALIDTRSGAEIIDHFDGCVEGRQNLRVTFANAHTLNHVRNDDNYRKVLNDTLILNDGIGINIASRLKYGSGFHENLNGTDFVPRYLSESRIKLRIFLFGARSEVAELCFKQCQHQFPQHEWLGFNNGYIGSVQTLELCESIREMQPDVLLVAMGNPLQEFWIHQYGASTGAKLCIGVGALFDFLAGNVNRAPSWVRRLHCEWLYRLVVEPGRMWRRYLIGNTTFLLAAWRDRHELKRKDKIT